MFPRPLFLHFFPGHVAFCFGRGQWWRSGVLVASAVWRSAGCVVVCVMCVEACALRMIVLYRFRCAKTCIVVTIFPRSSGSFTGFAFLLPSSSPSLLFGAASRPIILSPHLDKCYVSSSLSAEAKPYSPAFLLISRRSPDWFISTRILTRQRPPAPDLVILIHAPSLEYQD